MDPTPIWDSLMGMRAVVATTAVLLATGCGKPLERPANPDCTAPNRVTGGGAFAYEQRYSQLDFNQPITLTWHEDVPGYWYVVEKGGRVLRFVDDPATTEVEEVLNIQGQVTNSSETGLIGMTFHPDFGINGHVYAHYTNADNDLVSRIVRYTSTDGGATLGNEELILEIPQPFGNHNGGHLAFGPDGYLYIGMGDGGSSGDPLGNAQDLDSFHGKMLRIDVDGGSPYAIPADNPLAGGGGRPEIYAWGLRNPWRWSFDPVDGDLWLGDVGQNDREEVDIIVNGGNYGWNITEGDLCFPEEANCDRTDLIDPVMDYPTGDSASVIGGIVYRGSNIPGLYGRYVFSDYHSGNTWAILADGTGSDEVVTVASERIAHWEHGPDGEAWALALSGDIFTLVPDGAPPSGGTTSPALRDRLPRSDRSDPDGRRRRPLRRRPPVLERQGGQAAVARDPRPDPDDHRARRRPGIPHRDRADQGVPAGRKAAGDPADGPPRGRRLGRGTATSGDRTARTPICSSSRPT